MISQRFPPYLVKLLGAFLVGVFTCLLNGQALRAQQPSPASDYINPLDYLNLEFRPPKRGAPPKTVAGGSRGCNDATYLNNPMTALVPKIPSDSLPQTAFSLTSKDDPTFFWYIPQTIVQSTASLQFKLRDKDAQYVAYETEMPMLSQAGIISLKLPASHNGRPLLQAGEKYQWYLVAVCDEDDTSGDVYIQGWIERIDAASIPVNPDSNLAAALKKASAEKRFSLYAQNGIWHETLETLLQLRHSNPNDVTIRASWDKLLASVGLGKFSKVPLNSIPKIETPSN